MRCSTSVQFNLDSISLITAKLKNKNSESALTSNGNWGKKQFSIFNWQLIIAKLRSNNNSAAISKLHDEPILDSTSSVITKNSKTQWQFRSNGERKLAWQSRVDFRFCCQTVAFRLNRLALRDLLSAIISISVKWRYIAITLNRYDSIKSSVVSPDLSWEASARIIGLKRRRLEMMKLPDSNSESNAFVDVNTHFSGERGCDVRCLIARSYAGIFQAFEYFVEYFSEGTRARSKALLLLLTAPRIRYVLAIVPESQQSLPLAQLEGTSTTARSAQSKHTGPSGPYESRTWAHFIRNETRNNVE